MILARLFGAAAALLLAASSSAQALTDPTRPPLELMRSAATGAAPRTPLQSILLSSARQGAIINGQYVPLGGAYGRSRLVKITATEVTLKGDQSVEVLQLYPSVEKTHAVSGTGAITKESAKRP
jgi:MSHA biogenesis protein MshK